MWTMSLAEVTRVTGYINRKLVASDLSVIESLFPLWFRPHICVFTYCVCVVNVGSGGNLYSCVSVHRA